MIDAVEGPDGGLDSATDGPIDDLDSAGDTTPPSDALSDSMPLDAPDSVVDSDVILFASQTVNTNTSITLRVAGGAPPYRFAIVSGEGEVGTDTGDFFSPPFPQTVRISVTDRMDSVAEADVLVGGSNLYFVSGRDEAEAPTDEVFRSVDGGETWTTIGTVPEVNYNGGLLVFENRLLWIGGRPGGGTWASAVWQSADGVEWTRLGDLPEGRAFIHPTVFERRIWVAGGYNAGTRDDVWASPDGVAWVRMGALPLPLYGGPLLPKDGRLWYLGGEDTLEAGGRDEVWWTTDGATWTEAPSRLPGPCFGASGIVDDGLLVTIGGHVPPCETGVHRSGDGGSWALRGSLPGIRFNGGLTRHQGAYIYAAGDDDVVPASDTVWRSEDLITWTEIGTLPGLRNGGRLASFSPDL